MKDYRSSNFALVFFLVYVNDLADNLASDVRLFADDTSLFTIVYDETASAQVLNSDLKTIEEWAYQWKMQFNPRDSKMRVLAQTTTFRPLLWRANAVVEN